MNPERVGGQQFTSFPPPHLLLLCAHKPEDEARALLIVTSPLVGSAKDIKKHDYLTLQSEACSCSLIIDHNMPGFVLPGRIFFFFLE